jgi:hypothetical protein
MIGRMSRAGASAAPAVPRRRRRVLIASSVVWVVILLVAVLAWQWLAGMERLRRSQVYAEAVGRVGSHPQVLAALGQPVEAGWWVRGEFEAAEARGRAWLALPLAGPEGRGRLAAEARRQGDVWRFDRLEVALPDGTVVDLLAAPPPPDAPAAVADAAPRRPAPPVSTPPRPAPPAPWHDVGIERRS